MKIAIRVDASTQIGSGHFMRCLTLADALKARGARLRFVCRHLPQHCQEVLAEKGHEVKLLGNGLSPIEAGDLTHAHWLGATQAQDARDTVEALLDHAWDWVIVDHYALDARWESVLQRATRRLLVIDDIADRTHDCGVLLDQNFHTDMGSRYLGKAPEGCKVLLGPRYALLRDEFRLAREHIKPRTGPVQRVLVFFGGVDADNCTGRAIEALANLSLPDLHVDVVIGALHPFVHEIKSACAAHGFDCHVQVSRMAELMAAADLAVGASGSSTWERCCLGLPCVSMSLAQNQTAIGKAIDLLGAGQYIGSHHTASVADLQAAVSRLMQNETRRRSLSETAYSLVDGFGVTRVCEELSA